MKVIVIILGLSTLLMANTCRKRNEECKDGHFSFEFKNNSAKRLNRYMYWGNYPDTTIGDYNPTGFGVIEPKSQVKISSGPGLEECWETLLKNGKKEYLYLFDEDSLQAIPWETVRATNRGLLERREISLKYLQDNNFIITYP